MIDPNPFARLERRRFDPLKWAVLGVFFIVSYLLFYKLCLIPSSDISIHATWAAEGDFGDLTSFLHHGAHPLWHVIVRFIMLFGVPLEVSASLVTAVCKVAEVWLIHRLFTLFLKDDAPAAHITALSAACAVAACLCVPPYNPTVYLGVGTPNTWHSCTQLIALVFMLVCVPYTAHCYNEFVHLQRKQGPRVLLPWRKPLLLGVLLLMSLLAKPTFMQAFLPAACLYFLYQWIRHPKSSRFFGQIIVCVLPAVLFMIVQYMYYFGIIVPSQGDMVLEISLGKCVDVLVRTVLMQAFPIYAVIVCRKDAKRDSFFWLTVVFDVVGVVEFLILGENGRRAADGNFGWGMMGAALMMWVVAMAFYMRRLYARRKAGSKVCAVDVGGLALLGWHVVSGVYYVYYLFTSGKAL